jgi:hypothetical protein
VAPQFPLVKPYCDMLYGVGAQSWASPRVQNSSYGWAGNGSGCASTSAVADGSSCVSSVLALGSTGCVPAHSWLIAKSGGPPDASTSSSGSSITVRGGVTAAIIDIAASARAAMVAKVGGVFGTMRHPHLIQQYLAYYYNSMTTWPRTMGVLGVPLFPGGAIRRIYRYLIHLYIKNC